LVNGSAVAGKCSLPQEEEKNDGIHELDQPQWGVYVMILLERHTTYTSTEGVTHYLSPSVAGAVEKKGYGTCKVEKSPTSMAAVLVDLGLLNEIGVRSAVGQSTLTTLSNLAFSRSTKLCGLECG